MPPFTSETEASNSQTADIREFSPDSKVQVSLLRSASVSPTLHDLETTQSSRVGMSKESCGRVCRQGQRWTAVETSIHHFRAMYINSRRPRFRVYKRYLTPNNGPCVKSNQNKGTGVRKSCSQCEKEKQKQCFALCTACRNLHITRESK